MLLFWRILKIKFHSCKELVATKYWVSDVILPNLKVYNLKYIEQFLIQLQNITTLQKYALRSFKELPSFDSIGHLYISV